MSSNTLQYSERKQPEEVKSSCADGSGSDICLYPKYFLKHHVASKVDMDLYSGKARDEVLQLMNTVAAAYTERYMNLVTTDEDSSITEYNIQEGIGQLGLLYPMYSFMNIACIGHPFLQYDINVDKHFLNKHKIQMGKTYVWKRDSKFLADLAKYITVTYPVCGGDALKTAEAAQWILVYPKSVVFFAASGGDMHYDDISYFIEEMSLSYSLEVKAKCKTSMQLIVRCGGRWSEIYIFDAGSSTMTVQFIDRPRVSNLLERTKIIFLSGSCCVLMKMELSKIAYFASSRFKTLCLQICDGIIRHGMKEDLLGVISYIDTFFLSKKTALTLMKIFNIKVPNALCRWTAPHKIAQTISSWVCSKSKKACSVIMYESIKVAYVVTDTSKSKPSVKKYRSKFYKASNVIDLYGCENAFAGGYMAEFVQSGDIESCVNCAFFCASAVATQMGAHFPVNRHELLMNWQTEPTDEEDIDDCKCNL